MKSYNYLRLAITLAISYVIMYAVMFLNVDEASHIYFSITRCYMALLMVSPMAILMIAMMPKMYSSKGTNRIIVILSLAVFISTVILLRTQAFIGDKEYMKAMIPHHSSAILTSKHAHIEDANVRKLADSIIVSQEREILRMKFLLDTLNGNFK
jgi:glucose-6-phosphate-specific signal transduction histidine kinase